MSTDFSYNNSTISTTGGFCPNAKNTPLDSRTVVNNKADIVSIPVPFIGMEITVLQDETKGNKMTVYKVTALNERNAIDINTGIKDVTVPKNISDLINDSNFATTSYVTDSIASYVEEHKSELKGDKGEPGPQGEKGDKGNDGLTTNIIVNGNNYTHVNGTITLPNYPSVPTKTSDLTNDSTFVTNSEMQEAIANVSSGGSIDLSSYQPITDLSLQTTSKTVPGAINEINSSLNNKVETSDLGNAISSYVSENKAELKGDKGDKGDPGPQGIQGEKGETGATGAKGDKGDKGDTGATPNITVGTVTTGAAGSNASASITGTTPNLTLNMTIPTGAKGDKGEPGEQGPQGIQGEKGDTGAAGANGAKGDKGDPFTYADFTSEQLAALKGAKGDKGDKGDTGADGAKGDKGDAGAKGADGVTPTLSIGTVTTGAAGSSASVTMGGTAPSYVLNFTIPKGDKGDKGDTGEAGSSGSSGGIVFEDTYVSDANQWLTNGYTKTSGRETINLPSVCIEIKDKWGILFFIAENAAKGTGTQMFFPIDGTYMGKIFTRSLVETANPTLTRISNWTMLASKDDIIEAVDGIDVSGLQSKTDNSLNTTDKTIVGAINETFQSVSNGKTLIASAITDKGISTSNTDTFETMANNIASITTGSGSTEIKYVESIALDKNTATINLGETEQLTATLTPTDATIQDILWKSSNEAIATVNNGLISTLALGNANITATSREGYLSAICSIVIVDPYSGSYVTDESGNRLTAEDGSYLITD